MTTYYSQDHEWVKLNDDGSVTVGITNYAQEQLGDIVFVELPQNGTHFDAHATLTELESVKAVSDVYTPVSGTIIEKNDEIEKNPSLVNKDAEGSAWLCKINLDNPDELKELMSHDDYLKHIA